MARSAEKPHYTVLTWVDPDNHDKGLTVIGAAWNATSRDGKPYISVRLTARPFGAWDGSLQLHERPPDDVPV
jgi:uncharacterized protein (DUF736 family)